MLVVSAGDGPAPDPIPRAPPLLLPPADASCGGGGVSIMLNSGALLGGGREGKEAMLFYLTLALSLSLSFSLKRLAGRLRVM